MRRCHYLRMNRRARAADRIARAVGMRVIHPATEPVLFAGQDPRTAFLVDLRGSDLLFSPEPTLPDFEVKPSLAMLDWRLR